MSPDYPRPQRKEIRELLKLFDAAGWSITKPSTYYRVRCPCGLHQRMVRLTPSNPYYARNARAWLERQTCYKEK